jgi:Predicted membrane protein
MKAYCGRIALLIALFGLLFGLVPPSSAQTKSVVLERRDAVFTIREQNIIDVEEIWQVRFIGGPFHSATRTIPLHLVDDIRAWSVRLGDTEFKESNGGLAYSYTLSNSKDERSIKWLFPSVSNETLTFELSYQLVGALQLYEGGDQFSWTFIEADRTYPIESSQVTVIFPTDLPEETTLMASYLDDKELLSGVERVDARTLVFRNGPFEPGHTWSLRVQFPHQLFPVNESNWQQLERMRATFNLISLTLAGLIILLGILAWLMLWLRAHRTQARTVAEYLAQPPDDIPPALAGMLLDDRLLPRHLIATLVDLTRRNQLRIKRSWRMIEFERPTTDTNALHPFERKIYDQLFGSTLQSSANIYGGMYWRFERWRKYVIEEAIEEGYWQSDPEEYNQKRKKQARIMAWVLLVFGLVAYFWYFSYYAPLAFVVVIAASTVALIFGFFRPWVVQRGLKGDAMLMRLQAFKRYLGNIKRYSELDTAKEQFERYLPYAVAFGLEEQWTKAFAEVRTPAPGWFSNITRYREGAPQTTSASQSSAISSAAGRGETRLFQRIAEREELPKLGENRLFGRSTEHEARPSSTSSNAASASSEGQSKLFGKLGDSEALSSLAPSIPDFDSLSAATFNSLNSLSSDFFSMLNDAAQAFTPSSYVSSRQSSRIFRSDASGHQSQAAADSNNGFWDWFLHSPSSSSDSASSSSSRSSSSSSSRSSSRSSSWSSSRRSGGGGSSSFD